MLIKNNEARVHHIGLRNPNPEEQNDSIRLLPGLNEVPAAQWKEAKEHPIIAHQIKVGVFEEVITPEEPEAPKGTPQSEIRLVSLAEDKAVELVHQVLDRELLLKWKADETRPDALKAIEEQLKLLELSEAEKTKVMGKPGGKKAAPEGAPAETAPKGRASK